MGQNLARGAYVAVDPPHRVVFSWGIPDSETLPPGGSTVEVVLTPDGDNTMVVLTHRGLPSTHLDSHRDGWAHARTPARFGPLTLPWKPRPISPSSARRLAGGQGLRDALARMCWSGGVRRTSVRPDCIIVMRV
jgi:hypothetical protein